MTLCMIKRLFKSQSHFQMIMLRNWISFKDLIPKGFKNLKNLKSFSKNMSDLKKSRLESARRIFLKGVESVTPSKMIQNISSRNGSILRIGQCHLDLRDYRNSYIVGFGKAVQPMAEELLTLMGDRVARTILSIPHGSRDSMNPKIEVHKGAKNNIPDEDAQAGAESIHDLVKSLSKDDLLIILVSGGGSALLPSPIPPISLQEKQDLIRALAGSGANIHELNRVRRSISKVKGGGLVRGCRAGRILGLILSDVCGDDPSLIASGPTVRVETPLEDERKAALKLLHKYLGPNRIPDSVIQVLRTKGGQGQDGWTSPRGQILENFIIGNNRIALEGGAKEAQAQGYLPIILTTQLEGEASEVGHDLANLGHILQQLLTIRSNLVQSLELKVSMMEILKRLRVNDQDDNGHGGMETLLRPLMETEADFKDSVHVQGLKGLCLLFGGETVVTLRGKGKGGRNQELALAAAITLAQWPEEEEVVILGGGTDGIDGPTDAAGGIVHSMTVHDGTASGLDPLTFLNNNDSYNYFVNNKGGIYHLVTGHTGTNVMDMMMVLVPLPQQSQIGQNGQNGFSKL